MAKNRVTHPTERQRAYVRYRLEHPLAPRAEAARAAGYNLAPTRVTRLERSLGVLAARAEVEPAFHSQLFARFTTEQIAQRQVDLAMQNDNLPVALRAITRILEDTGIVERPSKRRATREGAQQMLELLIPVVSEFVPAKRLPDLRARLADLPNLI